MRNGRKRKHLAEDKDSDKGDEIDTPLQNGQNVKQGGAKHE